MPKVVRMNTLINDGILIRSTIPGVSTQRGLMTVYGVRDLSEYRLLCCWLFSLYHCFVITCAIRVIEYDSVSLLSWMKCYCLKHVFYPVRMRVELIPSELLFCLNTGGIIPLSNTLQQVLDTLGKYARTFSWFIIVADFCHCLCSFTVAVYICHGSVVLS